MHGDETFNRFDFYDHGTGHYHVKAMPTVEFESERVLFSTFIYAGFKE
jgi:hypothetical protein